MAVTLDVVGTMADSATGITTFDYTGITVGAGSNSALAVKIVFSLKTVSSISVTWDQGGTNQACTLITSQANGGSFGLVQMYGRLAPTSGNKTLRITWTGTSQIIVQVVAVTDADQAAVASTFLAATPATGNSTAPSITITSAVGRMTLDCVCADNNFFTVGSATKTQTFMDNNGIMDIDGAGSRAAGAASNTHAWTLVGGSQWASVGIDIVAAAAGGAFLAAKPKVVGQAVNRSATY